MEVTCTANTSGLVWKVTSNQGSKTTDQYTGNVQIGLVHTIGDFVFRLESKNPFVSTATLDEVRLKHNGTVLSCMDDPIDYLSKEIAQITIIVKGNKATTN